MYVSPLGVLVARHMQVGDTVEDIMSKAGISREQATTALIELSRKLLLTVTAEGQVSYPDPSVLSVIE
jgi:hypothetical protein